ncbi:spore coat protein [Clostridium sporogenes]|uniref:spore coat protein n=1 Tax=Clostridium sporogenes TaxID=1509 RepID=UPI002238DF62|nr:spore coat protein [Clostridium sporogenes]MCW6108859.1 spore coat protein [Clostridium sporogenes]
MDWNSFMEGSKNLSVFVLSLSDVILMVLQSMYNKYMMEISNPEVRQLFTQLRDSKMKNISHLQQEIKTMIDQGKA